MPLELALDVADPPLALALALALELTLPLALPPTELVTVTTPVAEPDPTEPNSVGTDVLNASVTGTTGASVVSDPAVRDPGDAVVAAETGVLPPTTFVNGCAELPSSESVETSTLNGSPHDDVLCAVPRPTRESNAGDLRTERRIFDSLDVEDLAEALG